MPQTIQCDFCLLALLKQLLKGVHARCFMYFCFFFSSFLRDTERQSTSGRGAEREGDTESEAGSRLWAVSTELYVGFELADREIVTWAEVGRLTDWATQAPHLGIHFHPITIVLTSWLGLALVYEVSSLPSLLCTLSAGLASPVELSDGFDILDTWKSTTHMEAYTCMSTTHLCLVDMYIYHTHI